MFELRDAAIPHESLARISEFRSKNTLNMFNRKIKFYLWKYVYHRRYPRLRVFFIVITTVFMVLIFYSKSFSKVRRRKMNRLHFNPNKTSMPLILRWAPVSGERGGKIRCGTDVCEVTNNKSRKGEQDIMMYSFYGSSFKPHNLPVPRRPGDIWGLIHEESPKNNGYIFSYMDVLEMFNFTSTFKRQSSYPIPTFGLKDIKHILDKKYVLSIEEKNEYRKLGLAPIVYVQSSCDAPSDRDKLVFLLQKVIPIDSYGKCMNNKILPESLSFTKSKSMAPMESDEFYKFLARYKFILAFENAVCDDYVTEKFWRALHIGVVPIIFGAPTIKDFLPDNTSAIITSDYPTVADLGQKIRKLDSNDWEYQKYLQYKSTGIKNTVLQRFLNMREWGPGTTHWNMFGAFTCFLCNKINDLYRNPELQYTDVTIEHYGCPAPKQIDSDGHYTRDDLWWKQEWLFAEYIAKAARYIYDKGVTVTETVLNTYANELFLKAKKSH